MDLVLSNHNCSCSSIDSSELLEASSDPQLFEKYINIDNDSKQKKTSILTMTLNQNQFHNKRIKFFTRDTCRTNWTLGTLAPSCPPNSWLAPLWPPFTDLLPLTSQLPLSRLDPYRSPLFCIAPAWSIGWTECCNQILQWTGQLNQGEAGGRDMDPWAQAFKWCEL